MVLDISLLKQLPIQKEIKFELDEKFLQTFKNVEINIPLLETIKEIPKYVKFLKELCTHKRNKLKGDVEIGRNVSALIKRERASALIQPTIPMKCKDPSTFTIPCTIGECTFADAMLDLGASINVMPSSLYKSLNVGDMELIGVIIQLANRSIAHPLDSYVLDMEDEPSSKGSRLILGKPFLMMTKTKIDVHAKILSMEFDDNMVHHEKSPKIDVHAKILSMEFDDNMVQFNIFEAMKNPIENHSIFGIDVIDYIGLFEFSNLVSVADVLEFSDFADVSNFTNSADFDCTCKGGKECSSCVEVVEVATSESSLELKPLLEHLKYAYLEHDQKLPVIISNNLQPEQEERLLQGLILLYACRGYYWRRKPDQLGSHRVVHKKSGMTVMKNQNDELVPTRIQNSCFGEADKYMNIHITPTDQHKTTFTYLFGTFAYTKMPFFLCNTLSTI
ncbi:hypothetical protein CR513_19289, partial [Mucuna pruriens]